MCSTPSSSRCARPGPRSGKFTLRLIPLHGNELSDNARTAIQDQTAIAYLGEIEPGTSQISVRDHQRAGAARGEPHRHRRVPDPGHARRSAARPATTTRPAPATTQTFARVVPTTAQEAKAIVAEMQSAALDASSTWPTTAVPTAPRSPHEVTQDASRRRALGLRLHRRRRRLLLRPALDAAAATRAFDAAAAANPSAKLFVPSALYADTFAAGLSARRQQNLYVSSPGFAASDLPAAGQQFVTSFRSAYGHQLRCRRRSSATRRCRRCWRCFKRGRHVGRQPGDRGRGLPRAQGPRPRCWARTRSPAATRQPRAVRLRPPQGRKVVPRLAGLSSCARRALGSSRRALAARSAPRLARRLRRHCDRPTIRWPGGG